MISSYGRNVASEAIIIKRRNSGESDRVVTFFSKEYGKIKIKAKGVRKINSKRSGYLEVFRYVKINIKSTIKNSYISEVESINRLGNYKNLRAISYAYYICELIDKLMPENEKNETVFDLIYDALLRLHFSSNSSHMEKIIEKFAIKLLRELGYLPENKSFNYESISTYVESVIEKPLRTPKLIFNV